MHFANLTHRDMRTMQKYNEEYTALEELRVYHLVSCMLWHWSRHQAAIPSVPYSIP